VPTLRATVKVTDAAPAVTKYFAVENARVPAVDGVDVEPAPVEPLLVLPLLVLPLLVLPLLVVPPELLLPVPVAIVPVTAAPPELAVPKLDTLVEDPPHAARSPNNMKQGRRISARVRVIVRCHRCWNCRAILIAQ
jgi:hypothetical protein